MAGAQRHSEDTQRLTGRLVPHSDGSGSQLRGLRTMGWCRSSRLCSCRDDRRNSGYEVRPTSPQSSSSRSSPPPLVEQGAGLHYSPSCLEGVFSETQLWGFWSSIVIIVPKAVTAALTSPKTYVVALSPILSSTKSPKIPPEANNAIGSSK